MWDFVLPAFYIPVLVSSAPATGILDTVALLFEVRDPLFDVQDPLFDISRERRGEELFSESDQTASAHSPLSLWDWQSDEKTSHWDVDVLKPERHPVWNDNCNTSDNDSDSDIASTSASSTSTSSTTTGDSSSDTSQSWESREATEDAGNVEAFPPLDLAAFERFKSPEDFTKRWSQLKRLVERLPRRRTFEQKRILHNFYYPLVAAGRLLKELGTKKFLQKFGKGTVTQMRENTVAEAKKKKAAERRRKVKMADGVDAKSGALGVVPFITPTSPKDFVKRWPEQKRLFESLPHPITPEQKSVLTRTYYQFAAAGRLLDELWEEEFLERFGQGSAHQMRKATIAEIKRRKAAEMRHQETARAGDVMGGSASDAVTSVRPKTPKDFTESWAEQKRLFEGLPRPLTPEQERIFKNTYYKFAAAGRLLEELGKETFLSKFGKGSITRMQQDATAEVKKKRALEEDQKLTEGMKETGDVKASGVVSFARPKSPRGFVKHWPEQKRRFEKLPRPITPEQRRELQNTYYRFVAVGKLLEELGEEAFLSKFEKSSVEKMLKAAKAKVEKQGTTEGEREVAAKRNNGKSTEERKKSDSLSTKGQKTYSAWRMQRVRL